MPRPKVHDDELRSRLRARAAELLRRHGAAGLSLRTLAADVGTSTTAVYALFGGKPGLVQEVIDDGWRQFGATLAGVAPGPDPAQDIVTLCLAYRDAALAAPHLYRTMFDGPAARPPSAAQQQAFAPLLRAVERAADAGTLRYGAAAPAVAVSLCATLHGLISLQLRGEVPPGLADPAEAFVPAVRAVVDGWRRPG